MPSKLFYDFFYRIGAPWEMGPRAELVRLVLSGRLGRGGQLRAIDLGCGSGANALYLAQQGFDVTGIDISAVGLAKAHRQARALGLSDGVRFVKADLTRDRLPEVRGPFDLLLDCCTLDDVRVARRRKMAATIKRLSKTGSCFLLWCFYGSAPRPPLFSLAGPSRLHPEGLALGEEALLFGDAFEIERVTKPCRESGMAVFLMRRR